MTLDPYDDVLDALLGACDAGGTAFVLRFFYDEEAGKLEPVRSTTSVQNQVGFFLHSCQVIMPDFQTEILS